MINNLLFAIIHNHQRLKMKIHDYRIEGMNDKKAETTNFYT